MRAIELTKGRVTVVDDEDFEVLAQWRWHLGGSGYAARTRRIGGRKTEKVLMHRVIMGNPEGMHIDHINGDPLDNRRSNLRIVTRFQNEQNRGKNKNNTSGYKGVTFSKKEQKWVAQITANGKSYRAGCHASPEAAAQAYNEAATRLHGEFATLNKIPQPSNN